MCCVARALGTNSKIRLIVNVGVRLFLHYGWHVGLHAFSEQKVGLKFESPPMSLTSTHDLYVTPSTGLFILLDCEKELPQYSEPAYILFLS